MATWISTVSLAVVLLTLVWRDGLNRGRVTTLLERLTDMAEDHEERIRDLEHVTPLSAVRAPAGHRQRQQRQQR